MEIKDRFVLVILYQDKSIKTIIGNFDTICNELEYQIGKDNEDLFKAEKMVVYDRKYSDNDLKLNCYYEIFDSITYSQFIDSYFWE